MVGKALLSYEFSGEERLMNSGRDQRQRVVIQTRTAAKPDHEEDLKGMSADQLLGMMWQLALNAWSFKTNLEQEPRLQRQVVVRTKRTD
jgi:hypothetical protein